MKEAYIIDGVRTPIGNYKGTLSAVRTDDLGALVIKEIVARNPTIPKEAYDDVIMGCANQAGEDILNVSRMSLLLAGLPFTVPGETVNRLCSSGLSAIIHANRAIKAGDGDIFISGGVENMDSVLQSVQETEGLIYTKKFADNERPQALKCLEAIEPSIYRDSMTDLVNFVVDRSF